MMPIRCEYPEDHDCLGDATIDVWAEGWRVWTRACANLAASHPERITRPIRNRKEAP